MIITTRFRVFKTLCVIGGTHESTQNEDSWYMKKWKPDAAVMYRSFDAGMPLLSATLHAAGNDRSPPGSRGATGSNTAEATNVSTASWLVFLVVASSPMSPVLPNFV